MIFSKAPLQTQKNHKRGEKTCMTAKTLKTGWKMHSLQENEWVPAKVPGSVYQAYLDAGKMEDPFYRDNEEKART